MVLTFLEVVVVAVLLVTAVTPQEQEFTTPLNKNAQPLVSTVFQFERNTPDGFGVGGVVGYVDEHLIIVPGVGQSGVVQRVSNTYALPLNSSHFATTSSSSPLTLGGFIEMDAPTFVAPYLPLYSTGGVLRNGRFVFGGGIFQENGYSWPHPQTCTDSWFALNFSASDPGQSSWDSIGTGHGALGGSCSAVVDGDLFVLGGTCGPSFTAPPVPAPFTRVDGDTMAFQSLPAAPGEGTAFCAMSQVATPYEPLKNGRLYASFRHNTRMNTVIYRFNMTALAWETTAVGSYSSSNRNLYAASSFITQGMHLMQFMMTEHEESGDEVLRIAGGIFINSNAVIAQSTINPTALESYNAVFELHTSTREQLFLASGTTIPSQHSYVVPVNVSDRMLVIPAFALPYQYGTQFELVHLDEPVVVAATDDVKRGVSRALTDGGPVVLPVTGTLRWDNSTEVAFYGDSVVSDHARGLVYFVGGKAVNRAALYAHDRVLRWNISEPMSHTTLPHVPTGGDVELGRAGACVVLSGDGEWLFAIGGAVSHGSSEPPVNGVYDDAHRLRVIGGGGDEEWEPLVQTLDTRVHSAACYSAHDSASGKEFAVLVSGREQGFGVVQQSPVPLGRMQVLSISSENDTEAHGWQFADVPLVQVESPAVARVPRAAPLGEAAVYLFGGFTPMLLSTFTQPARLFPSTAMSSSLKFNETTNTWLPLGGPIQFTGGACTLVLQERYIYVMMGISNNMRGQWQGGPVWFVNNYATPDQYVTIYDAKLGVWVNDSLPYSKALAYGGFFGGATSPDTVMTLPGDDTKFVIPQTMTPYNSASPFQLFDFDDDDDDDAEPPPRALVGERPFEENSHFVAAGATLGMHTVYTGPDRNETTPDTFLFSATIVHAHEICLFGGVADNIFSAASFVVNWTACMDMRDTPARRAWIREPLDGGLTLPRRVTNVGGVLLLESDLALFYGGYPPTDEQDPSASLATIPIGDIYVYNMSSHQLLAHHNESSTDNNFVGARAYHFMLAGMGDYDVLFGGGLRDGHSHSDLATVYTATMGLIELSSPSAVPTFTRAPDFVFGPAARIAAGLSQRTRTRAYFTSGMVGSANPTSNVGGGMSLAILDATTTTTPPSEWVWKVFPKRLPSYMILNNFVAELEGDDDDVTISMMGSGTSFATGPMRALESTGGRFVTSAHAPSSAYDLSTTASAATETNSAAMQVGTAAAAADERPVFNKSMLNTLWREKATFTCTSGGYHTSVPRQAARLLCQGHDMPYPGSKVPLPDNSTGWTMLEQQPSAAPDYHNVRTFAVATLSPSRVMIIGGSVPIDGDPGNGRDFVNNTHLFDPEQSIAQGRVQWLATRGPDLPDARIGYQACVVDSLKTVFLYQGFEMPNPFGGVLPAGSSLPPVNVSAWHYEDGDDPDVGGDWLAVAEPCPNPRNPFGGVFLCMPRRRMAMVFGRTALDASRQMEVEVLTIDSPANASWGLEAIAEPPLLFTDGATAVESPSGESFFVLGGRVFGNFPINNLLIHQYNFAERAWVVMEQSPYVSFFNLAVGAGFMCDNKYLAIFGPALANPSYFQQPFLAYTVANDPYTEFDHGSMYFANFTTEFGTNFPLIFHTHAFVAYNQTTLLWFDMSSADENSTQFAYIETCPSPLPVEPGTEPPETTEPPTAPLPTLPPPPSISFAIGLAIIISITAFIVLFGVLLAGVLIAATTPSSSPPSRLPQAPPWPTMGAPRPQQQQLFDPMERGDDEVAVDGFYYDRHHRVFPNGMAKRLRYNRFRSDWK